MRIDINDFCLVVLLGEPARTAAFASRHFPTPNVIALAAHEDGMLASSTRAALDTSLAARDLTVIDAAGASSQVRDEILKCAKHHHARVYALTAVGPSSPTRRSLAKGNYRGVYEIKPSQDLGAIELVISPLPVDRRELQGPFDIIGDVHGCFRELCTLLERLEYEVRFKGKGSARRVRITAPENRTVIFVGDLVDRGPAAPDVLRIAMQMALDGTGYCVLGNHDIKFLRWLKGRTVRLSHGLERTVDQMKGESADFRRDVLAYLDALPIHLWLANGKLAVAHAGIKAEMLGRTSGAIAEFCLYGDHSGEKDTRGLPMRYNWALDYEGDTQVIYGHTPVPEARWQNNTLCIDTGCCFGGALTGLRWPENEIISVPARAEYVKSARPFGHPPPRPKGKT